MKEERKMREVDRQSIEESIDSKRHLLSWISRKRKVRLKALEEENVRCRKERIKKLERSV